jgi:hypothetical protein
MVMKESLVSQVDSTETLAPKPARGERLAAAKAAKKGFSQRFFDLRRMAVLHDALSDRA